jgi:hypothetical protein
MLTFEPSGSRRALCTNRDCRREYWYFPKGGFDERSNEEIPPSQAPKYCRSCGQPVLASCPGCSTPLETLPTEEEPYCEQCGVDLLKVEQVPCLRMTVSLRPEHGELIAEVLRSGACHDANELIGGALELLRKQAGWQPARRVKIEEA